MCVGLTGDNGSMSNLEVGNNIRKARRARGWTLRELAKRVHLSYGYLNQIEKGRRKPSLSALQAIADTLDMPVASLIGSGEKAQRGPIEIKDLLVSDAPVLYQGQVLPNETKRKVAQMLDAALSLRKEPEIEAVSVWHEGKPISKETILELAKEVAKEVERMQEKKNKTTD